MNKFGDIELCLDCRSCIERGKMAETVVGLTAGKKIQVFCRDHGNIVTFALDGSDLDLATTLLATGCESCRTGKPHMH